MEWNGWHGQTHSLGGSTFSAGVARAERGSHGVPGPCFSFCALGLPHVVTLIELRLDLISYQDHYMLLLTLAGSWKKWHEGAWREPALGGQATAVPVITGAHVYMASLPSQRAAPSAEDDDDVLV